MIEPLALADADGDPFMGRVIGDRFGILSRIGAGATGTVYRARQFAVGRDVAIKIVRADRLVDPQSKGRFRREARATSLLRSPYTVTVFDFGEVHVEDDAPEGIDGSLYLAMELLDGESLGDRLKREGRLSIAEAMTVMRHTLQSLVEAHGKGIVHRDLKPDNLILIAGATGEEPELCKVLDFGIAKLLTHEGGVDALETQAGTVFGTPRYMSPEQAQGKALDARSDLYALGVILYHMLVGEPPYTDSDAVVVMAHHIKTPPKRPSVVAPDRPLPPALEQLLMRVLEKKPDRRPQDAATFLRELEALDISAEVSQTDINAVLSGAPASSKVSRWLLAAAAAAVVLASGFYVATRSSTPTAQPAIEPTIEPVRSVLGSVEKAASVPVEEPAPAPVPSASASAAPSASTSAAASASVKQVPKRPGKRRKKDGGTYRRFDRH